ncbi:MAG TPA: hypothetical protein VMH61_02925 [Candidatus Acidoferrales bacterium]|nr:hypothetical protein [Candidatus Acidoferrales bacterium]
MLPLVPLGPRARVAAALAAAAACAIAAIAGIAACLTAPPADIGTSTNERPLIVHTTVQPPEGLLNGWPPQNAFLVPVQLPDPTANCEWRLFDKDTESQEGPVFKGESACLTSVLDGGVVVEDPPVGAQPTDGHCHVFTFMVGHGFSALQVFDSIGGDALSWEYEPPGVLCNFYDAGAFQDGAFPPGDAGADGLPVTPESGPSPESGVDP